MESVSFNLHIFAIDVLFFQNYLLVFLIYSGRRKLVKFWIEIISRRMELSKNITVLTAFWAGDRYR